MAYAIHIERDAGPIPEDAWREVIEGDPTLSYAQAAETTNPTTGEVIRIAGGHSDATWNDGPWFCYFEGRISVAVRSEAQRIIEKAIDIAGRLNAQVHGDDGEIYE